MDPQLTAFFTSAAILASSAAVNSFSAKATGHMAPSSRFASCWKPNVAYLVLNFSALWKKQTTLPSLAYAGIPYQSLRREGRRAGFDDRMEPLGDGAIRFRHRGDRREHRSLAIGLLRCFVGSLLLRHNAFPSLADRL